MEIDPEAVLAKTPRELPILVCRPHAEYPVGRERRAQRVDPAITVEPRIAGGDQRVRAVVHVEQHGGEPPRIQPQRDGDVDLLDAHPWVVERMAGERAERTFVPGHDSRHQFRDDDGGRWRENVERGAEREAHAQAADEYVWIGVPRDAAARERGERILRSVHLARHERPSVGEQQVLAITTLQGQRSTVGSGRLTDEDPGLQRARSMDFGVVRAGRL